MSEATKIPVALYLYKRLHELGVRGVHGVPVGLPCLCFLLAGEWQVLKRRRFRATSIWPCWTSCPKPSCTGWATATSSMPVCARRDGEHAEKKRADQMANSVCGRRLCADQGHRCAYHYFWSRYDALPCPQTLWLTANLEPGELSAVNGVCFPFTSSSG